MYHEIQRVLLVTVSSLLCLNGFSALAQPERNWLRVITDDSQGYVFYIDINSIRREGDISLYDDKVIFNKPIQGAASTIRTVRTDCTDGASILLKAEIYNNDGNLMRTLNIGGASFGTPSNGLQNKLRVATQSVVCR